MSLWLFYIILSFAMVALMLLIWLLVRSKNKMTNFALMLWQSLRLLPDFSLLRLLIRNLNTGNGGLYETPWLLVIGEPGSGRSELLASLQSDDAASLQQSRFLKQDQHRSWKLFAKGVLIDGPNDQKALQKTLNTLNRLRPERPLDGLVLTISADTLLSTDEQHTHESARHLQDLLWVMQKATEFNLPIYWVITQSDRIEGFTTFWEQFPKYQQQIFGWSSPYEFDSRFTPAWCSTAISEITQQLYLLQNEGLVQAQEHPFTPALANSFLRFARRMEELAPALTNIASTVFDHSGHAQPARLRGIYFTGQLKPQNDLVGADQLAQNKWFSETNLAQPLRKALLSRNRNLRWTQWASLALFIGFAGLGVWDLFKIQQQSIRLGQQVNQYLAAQSVDGDCYNINRDILSNEIKQVGQLDFPKSTWLIPVTWVSTGFTAPIASKIASGPMEKQWLPGFRCFLIVQAKHLLHPTMKIDSIKTDAPNTGPDLLHLSQQVLQYETNLQAWRQITQTGETVNAATRRQAFALLSGRYLQEPIPVSGQAIFATALQHPVLQKAIPLEANYQQRLLNDMGQQSASLANSWLQQIDLGSGLLDNLMHEPTPSSLTKTLDWADGVSGQWLNGQNDCTLYWQQLDELMQELVRRFDYPASLATKVTAALTQTRCSQPVTSKLKKLSWSPLSGLVQTEAQNTNLTWAPGFSTRLDLYRSLLKQPLLTISVQPPRRCDITQQFTTAGVLHALSFVKLYQQALQILEQSKISNDPLLNKLLSIQLQNLVEGAIGQVQKPAKRVRNLEVSLQNDGRNFNQVVGHLNLLAALYIQLDIDLDAAPWFKCVNRTALRRLVQIENLYDSNQLYLPQLAADNSNFFYQAHQQASANAWLSQQRQRAEQLLGYARSWNTWFLNGGADSFGAFNITRVFWDNSIKAYDSFTLNKDTTSHLAVLQTYFTNAMTTLDHANCNVDDKGLPDTLSDDIFSYSMETLQNDIELTCTQLTRANFIVEYRQLYDAFNQYLAGQYPFAGTEARDIDPAMWNRFSTSQAANIELLAQGIGNLNDNDPRLVPIQKFIAELQSAKAALDVLYKADVPQTLDLNVQFRTLRPFSPGTEKILQWSLTTNNQSLNYPHGKAVMAWMAGNDMGLTLEWAGLSLIKPDVIHNQEGLVVMDNLAIFTDTGPWSLIRFIQKHRINTHITSGPYDLQFKIPVIKVDQGKESLQSQVNANISLAITEAVTKTSWTLPSQFPTQAPKPWQGAKLWQGVIP